ncbi:MAG: hypothetical protein HQL67_06705 [Magnetococcales bacterium]|nr:hypothetical protein [Magnetococcales bacterium]
MLDWLLIFISHPMTPWLSVALILAWGLVGWLLFRAKVTPLHAGLERAIRQIQSAANPRHLGEIFDQVDFQISQIKPLAPAWSQFRATVKPAADRTLQSEKKPNDFLNFENLVLANINLPFYRALPTYLIGVGLLVTVAGFSSAFYFAYHGLSSPDIETVQNALAGIVSIASVKFSASFAGLLAGLVFYRTENYHSRQLDEKIKLLCHLISQRIESDISHGHLTENALKQLFPTLSDQLMEQLSKGWNGSATKLESQLVQAVRQAISPLSETLRLQGEGQYLEQILLRDQIVVSANQQIGKSMAEQGEELKKTATHLDHSLSVLDRKVEGLQQPSLEPIIQTIKSELNQLLENQTETTHLKMEQLVERVVAEAMKSESGTQQLKQILRSMQKQLDDQSPITSLVRSVKADLFDVNQQMQQQPDLKPLLGAIRSETVAISDSLNGPNGLAAIRRDVEAKTQKLSSQQLETVQGTINQLSGSLRDTVENRMVELETVTGRLDITSNKLEKVSKVWVKNLKKLTKSPFRTEQTSPSDRVVASLDERAIKPDSSNVSAVRPAAMPWREIHSDLPALDQKNSMGQSEPAKNRSGVCLTLKVGKKAVKTKEKTVEADHFATRSREGVFYNLLKQLSDQLSVKRPLNCKPSDPVIDDLMSNLQDGADINDTRIIDGVGRLGDLIGALELSVLDENQLNGLDRVLMGLAQFLKENFTTPSQQDARETIAPPKQDLEVLLDHFQARHQKKSTRYTAVAKNESEDDKQTFATVINAFSNQSGQKMPTHTWHANEEQVKPVTTFTKAQYDMGPLIKTFNLETAVGGTPGRRHERL